jgi:hypothetical protein
MSIYDILNFEVLEKRTPVMIETGSVLAIGVDLASHGNSTTSSRTWGVANSAVYIPFINPATAVIKKLFHGNAAVVSGNIDVGIYDEDGNRLVSAGSTAQAGTSTIQAFDVTDITIPPGRYYIAVAFDNTTGTSQSWLMQTTMPGWGLAYQTAAFPLPATATFAALAASAIIPTAGLSLRDFVI